MVVALLCKASYFARCWPSDANMDKDMDIQTGGAGDRITNTVISDFMWFYAWLRWKRKRHEHGLTMIITFLIIWSLILNIIKMSLLLSSFVESCEMENTAVMTPDSSSDKSSRDYMVTWFNNLLKTNFKDVRQMGSGDSSVWAELIQLFHLARLNHTEPQQAMGDPCRYGPV